MAFTNAELVRQEAGDSGVHVRDVASGDGISTTFYASTFPILTGSERVIVGGVALVEGAGAGKYTMDDLTGEVIFGTAPPLATENIVLVYRGVQIKDAAIEEACRQYGLVATATADTGPSAPVLSAAAMVCNWKASEYANEFDFDTDGQSFKMGSRSKMWADRAEALRLRANTNRGLTSIESVKVDGYSESGEYASREYATSAQNPRRRFYGQPDRIP